MKARLSLLLCAAAHLFGFAVSEDYSPFSPAFLNYNYDVLDVREFSFEELAKRQTCPSGDANCGNGACCKAGSTCTSDPSGHVACCPTTAICTGTINIGTATTLVAGGGATTTASSSVFLVTGSSTASSGTGILFPSTTTAIASTAGATAASFPGGVGGGSTVAGAPYPFIYIPTSYANAQACSSAYSECQSQYSACQVSLGGGVGVTISAPNGGVTQQTVAASSASAICSSLSSSACYGLQAGQCNAFGTSGETVTAASTSNGNSFVITSANAAPTHGPGSGGYYEVGMGVAVGIAGLLV